MNSALVLIFETHATSLDNEAGLASGWFDVALSTKGEEQARQLGERRRHEVIAAVYCSDLIRSWRTGEIAFRDRAVPIIRDARLRECDYGDLTRQPTVEIERRRVRHLTDPFPGGESYQQAADRVSTWLRDAAWDAGASAILVIGHRATFYALEHLLRGVTLHDAVTSSWSWQPGWSYDLRALSR